MSQKPAQLCIECKSTHDHFVGGICNDCYNRKMKLCLRCGEKARHSTTGFCSECEGPQR